MTREEAKEYITNHCNPYYPDGKTKWETAINMAISALEQPEIIRCKDCRMEKGGRMRLIDADKLIAEYDRVHIGEPGGARKLMVDAPTIEERKTGKWIEVDDDLISGKCSACGWEAHLYEDDVVGMPYCPHCGADMRGGNHETD